MSEDEADEIHSINVKTLATLSGVLVIICGMVGGYFVQSYKVDQNTDSISAVRELTKSNTDLLLQPRFTLEDYLRAEEQKDMASRREMDRRAQWMVSQDSFRREAEKAITSTSKDVETIKGLVYEIKDDLKKIQ